MTRLPAAIIFCLTLFNQTTAARQANTLPFTVELEPISLPAAPALHSFAFAQADGKWLFIGGRTNGLHGFFAATGFPDNDANKKIWVVDPASGRSWSIDLSGLPNSIADPLRATNPQFYQSGNRLYIIGGYGRDSAQDKLLTFGVLTAVEVSAMIQAVMVGGNIRPFIRQLTDARLQVTGGELKKLGEFYYLVFGHDFAGFYARTAPTYAQNYTNEIKKFRITDNGATLGLSDYTAIRDNASEEFHRRDLNVVHTVLPNGAPGLAAYGGVFRTEADLPYLHPIYIDAGGATVDKNYEQLMSHYTCANMGIFDPAAGTMHTTFFGGISLNYFDENSGTLKKDELVPFIDDITTLSRFADGVSTETILPVRLPQLLGANAVFILDSRVPVYDNEVIKLEKLSGKTFVGHLFGGIKAAIPNFTPSSASDMIFKIYVTPKPITAVQAGLPFELAERGYRLSVAYPNPTAARTQFILSIHRAQHVAIEVFDLLGRRLALVHDGMLAAEQTHSFSLRATAQINGLVVLRATGEDFTATRKVVLLK